MNQFQIDFTKGYMCALANIIASHGRGTEIENAFRDNYTSLKEMREIGIEERDIELLMPVIKEVDRKRSL